MLLYPHLRCSSLSMHVFVLMSFCIFLSEVALKIAFSFVISQKKGGINQHATGTVIGKLDGIL